MTSFLKSFAIAGALSVAASTSFAAAHLSVETVTCEEFLAMDADGQVMFAEAAFKSLSDKTGSTARTEPMSEEEALGIKTECEGNTSALAVDAIGGVTSK